MDMNTTNTPEELSQDVARIRAKRFSIENQLCDMFKFGNEILENRRYANTDESKMIIDLQRMCMEMLRVSFGYPS